MDENGLAILLFGAAAVFCIVYAIYQHVSIMLNKEKINYVNATIIETATAMPETMKINNSKWAYVRFWVDGKEYISSKRIQVSMNSSVGDEIEVAYFKDNPSVIFTPNWKKERVFLIIGILCLAIMVYLKSKSSL
ncbi:hypothetical protein [Maledivibacter halophilus]|uniref:DUF3592 domain-containing protein n=1 Tax=Maledivibacter halophilus TaxID=36842 RepID=A0A1T5LPB9_9FIRM|nr:hypothetical protein [Maledivibacter halophilus]SKC77833.1 hypothetical protein SAMN02194393_03191 [Maledivibacter halophilus]